MTSTEVLTGREYLRVSKDRNGTGKSPAQQHDDNLTVCPQFGITLGEPYRDDDRSASRYARKVREDFQRLLDDLENDTFGAQVLVLWESARGSRRAGEWVLLVDLLEERGVLVFVTTHRRMYDPANPRDRKTLLEDAIDSEYESAKTHLRIKRDAASNAAKGRPNGICRYGYERVYDATNGTLVGERLKEDEWPNVDELFARLEKGHALKAIAKDWQERGIHTRPRLNKDTGEMEWRWFSPQVLRKMATNPAYMGIRVHDPNRWAPKDRQLPNVEASRYPAIWPAIVTKKRFMAVQAILTDGTRRTSRDGRAKHLLSRIGLCHVCGEGLNGYSGRDEDNPRYRCPKGCVMIAMSGLDELAETVVLGYLALEENYSAFTPTDENPALQAVQADLAEARREHDALAASTVSVALAAKKEPAILARIAALEAREEELLVPVTLAGLMAPGADVAKRWKVAPVTTRRKVARYLLSPEYLGLLMVKPAVPGRKLGGRFAARVPVADRVVFRRKRKNGKTKDLRSDELV